jgi:hypothetical protein
MSEWDGKERRGYAELREVIREEIEPLRKAQTDIERKIADWENGAKWFRHFVLGTVTLITLAAGAYEWLKAHLR